MDRERLVANTETDADTHRGDRYPFADSVCPASLRQKAQAGGTPLPRPLLDILFAKLHERPLDTMRVPAALFVDLLQSKVREAERTNPGSVVLSSEQLHVLATLLEATITPPDTASASQQAEVIPFPVTPPHHLAEPA